MGYSEDGRIMFVVGQSHDENGDARFIHVALEGVPQAKYCIVMPNTDLIFSAPFADEYLKNFVREKAREELWGRVDTLLQDEEWRGIVMTSFFSPQALLGLIETASGRGIPRGCIFFVENRSDFGVNRAIISENIKQLNWREFVRLLASID